MTGAWARRGRRGDPHALLVNDDILESVLTSNVEREHPGTCFALMPFSADFTPVYGTIRDAVQSPEVGFSCRRLGNNENALD